MINFDDYANKNNGVALKTIYNKNWPYIPDHPYRTLVMDVQDLEKQIYY